MYKKTAKIPGDTTMYCLSSGLKKYSLRDVGFQESANGKFTLQRNLDVNSPFNSGVMLKVVVTKDLKTFKLATTARNGLANVNIFKGKPEEVSGRKKQLDFYLNELVERDIIVKK